LYFAAEVVADPISPKTEQDIANPIAKMQSSEAMETA